MMTYGLVFIARSAMFFPRMMSEFRLRNHWKFAVVRKLAFRHKRTGRQWRSLDFGHQMRPFLSFCYTIKTFIYWNNLLRIYAYFLRYQASRARVFSVSKNVLSYVDALCAIIFVWFVSLFDFLKGQASLGAERFVADESLYINALVRKSERSE